MALTISILIGLIAGICSGLFGIGGGVIIVPALVYLLHFSIHKAVGTSLAVLLPPVGAAAVLAYYRTGNVDIRTAIVLAVMVFSGAWLGTQLAEQLSEHTLRTMFGIFLILLGCYTLFANPA